MPHGNSPNWISLGWKYLMRAKVDPMQMVSDNKSVMGFNLIWLYDQVEKLGPLVDEMIHYLINSSNLLLHKPYVDKEFPFNQCKEAIHYLQSGGNCGKVVLTLE
jgi:NADPH:quinone reductase-like Zn-dependent oxidoreductase